MMVAETTDSFSDSTGDYAQIDPKHPRKRFRLEVGARTHPGLCRPNNEDGYLVATLTRGLAVAATSLDLGESPVPRETVAHLLIVADGMGGVAGGERASTLAIGSLRDFFAGGFRSFPHLDPADEATVIRELKIGIERADKLVVREAAADPHLDGMGTTLTMAYGIYDSLFVLHAGDSRFYLHRAGRLSQVTTDHTLVQMMVEGGMLTAEDARTHQNRNVVTNVVGGPSEGVQAETHRLKFVDGDTLLLCSDGLTEPVDDATIAAILAGAAGPDAAAEALVAEACRRGGPDNVTVLVARVHAEG